MNGEMGGLGLPICLKGLTLPHETRRKGRKRTAQSIMDDYYATQPRL